MPSAVEHENILIAIDDSAATWRAVDYVADLGRTSQRLCVHLFHADFYPPDLQESRGGTTANEEEEVEAQLERKQQRWERRMQGAAAHLFNKARELFVDHLSEEISRRAPKLYVKVIE